LRKRTVEPVFGINQFTAAGSTGAVQAAVDAFGGIDVLVNNASTAITG
jgi:NAD(P)-dependent dehydrogenase (short-subunit alcohol dehydrogenase family)